MGSSAIIITNRRPCDHDIFFQLCSPPLSIFQVVPSLIIRGSVNSCVAHGARPWNFPSCVLFGVKSWDDELVRFSNQSVHSGKFHATGDAWHGGTTLPSWITDDGGASVEFPDRNNLLPPPLSFWSLRVPSRSCSERWSRSRARCFGRRGTFLNGFRGGGVVWPGAGVRLGLGQLRAWVHSWRTRGLHWRGSVCIVHRKYRSWTVFWAAGVVLFKIASSCLGEREGAERTGRLSGFGGGRCGNRGPIRAPRAVVVWPREHGAHRRSWIMKHAV
jgi:hypothetical protein